MSRLPQLGTGSHVLIESHSVDRVFTANPRARFGALSGSCGQQLLSLDTPLTPTLISGLCVSPRRFSPRLRVNREVAWPTSMSSTRTCCPSSGAITCSWRRRTPMNGLSRAGLPAARPVEEVSAIVVLWVLWGALGGRGEGGGRRGGWTRD